VSISIHWTPPPWALRRIFFETKKGRGIAHDPKKHKKKTVGSGLPTVFLKRCVAQARCFIRRRTSQ
jgi:hypothetical protein